MSGRIRLTIMDSDEYAPASMTTVTEDIRTVVWKNEQGEVIAQRKLRYPGMRVGDKFECSIRNGEKVLTYQRGPWTGRQKRDQFLWQSPLVFTMSMCASNIRAYVGLVLGASFMMFVLFSSVVALLFFRFEVTVRSYVPYLLVILSLLTWGLGDEVVSPLIILLSIIACVFVIEYWNPPFLSVLGRELDSFLDWL